MPEVNYVVAKQIKKFLKRDEPDALKIFLSTLDLVTIAEILKFLSDDEKVQVINLLPVWLASEVLSETDEHSQEDIVDELESEELGTLLEEMETDNAVDILDDLEKEEQEAILAGIEKDRAQVFRELLQYPEDSAGGIMVPEVLSIKQGNLIGDAVRLFKDAHLREEVEDIQYIYVIDESRKLTGLLPLKALIINAEKVKVKDVMERSFQSVRTDEDQEVVANIGRKYDLYAVPVVDSEGRLVGRITADDILDVMEEEATEDLSHIAGVTDEDFGEESVLRSVKNRVPWLIVGLIGGIISATVIFFFEGALKIILALAFFVPVIMAMGGSAGVQSSAIIVKSLAVGDIHPKFFFDRIFREFQIAFINGLICATLLSVIVYYWRDDFFLGCLIGLALMFVIIFSTIIGTSVPLLLKALDIDPAIAMGPFVTTSNDVIGLLIYLGLATLFIELFL